MSSIEVVKNTLFFIPALKKLQVADSEQRAFSYDDPSKKFNAAFGMPFANMALRLFMASAVSLPPNSPRTLEELNVSVDLLIGSAHGLSSGEALMYISGAIRAIDEWEKSHRKSKVYDSLDVAMQIKLAGLFKLRAQLTEQLGQDYKLAVDDLRNAAEIYKLQGRRFEGARLLEEIGDIKRRNGDAINASVDYSRAAAEYGSIYADHQNGKRQLPGDVLNALGPVDSGQESVIVWTFRISMHELISRVAQKNSNAVTAIVELEEARKDIATALSLNKLPYEVAVSEDRRLEAEIGYLEKVQDGTIAYTTTSGFGPLLPADFPTIKKAVDRVVAKYGGFDFAKVRWQDATVISGWLKEIDHAIEQAGKLSRYSRDMRFDAAEQLKAEHTVAELNGFGGMLAIAGDFENADIFYSAAVRIYSETGQHVKAAEMEVQYASCLANKGLIEKAKHFFESAGRLYEIAAKAAETPVEKMLALELAGDMYRRGGKDLQARQMYEEAVVVEAKPGKDDSRLPEHRRRIVEKLTVINEKLVLQMIMTDLDRIYLNFDGLSPNERQRTAERCLKDWNRLSEAEQMGWREIGKGGAFIKGPGYVSERYISNWTDAQSAAVEADRVGGVEERKDGDIVREGGKRPAAESRGAVEGRPGGIGK